MYKNGCNVAKIYESCGQRMIDSKKVFSTSKDIENQGQYKFKQMNSSLLTTAC